ncbi:MAG: sporulation protein YunB [Erysipelotrichaceae bacterium]
MHFINYKKRRYYSYLLIASLIGFSCYQVTNHFNQYLEPRLLSISKSEATRAISALSSSLLQTMNYDEKDLYEINKNENGSIKSINYNTKALNKILKDAIKIINNSLDAADQGKKDPYLNKVIFKDGVLYKISLGTLSNLSILNDLGPDISVRLQLFHNVSGTIKTKMEPYGLNNTLMKIILKIKMETEIGTVLDVSKIVITNELPLVIQIIHGDLPNYVPFTTHSTPN